jgi:hypothetical protein
MKGQMGGSEKGGDKSEERAKKLSKVLCFDNSTLKAPSNSADSISSAGYNPSFSSSAGCFYKFGTAAVTAVLYCARFKIAGGGEIDPVLMVVAAPSATFNGELYVSLTSPHGSLRGPARATETSGSLRGPARVNNEYMLTSSHGSLRGPARAAETSGSLRGPAREVQDQAKIFKFALQESRPLGRGYRPSSNGCGRLLRNSTENLMIWSRCPMARSLA